MKPVPWRCISSWRCIGCSKCCVDYIVNIKFEDWMQITKQYGFGLAIQGLTEFYLKKGTDGRCIFQYKLPGSNWLCGIQHIKPRACKLWPFMIKSRPVYGREKEAIYTLDGKTYYVYLNANCSGISWGNPSKEFIHKIVPKFIQLSFRTIKRQVNSTSRSPFIPQRII